MNGMKLIRVLSLLATSSLLISCTDADPFGRDKRALVSVYDLYLFDESGRYYVVKHRHKLPDDVFGGAIQKIAWNSEYVLALVDKAYEGDPDGWYYLSVKTGLVVGPLADAQIASNQALSTLRIMTSSEAFKSLKE